MKQFILLVLTVILSNYADAFGKQDPRVLKDSRNQAREQQLLVELTGKDPSVVTDISLYGEIVSAYDGGDEIGFISRMQSLLNRFPQSTYADNVLYLAGLMAVNNKNYPEAVRYFSRVETEYSMSDKVTSAVFAKAMTYRKMNLHDFARRLLVEVKSKYPGSPESFRADSEIKMMSTVSK